MRFSRRQALAGAAALAGIAAARAPVAAAAPDPALDAALAGAIGRGDVPGAAVMVTQAGVPVFARGYGLADRVRRIPVTAGTVFRIGSLTKQFTAAAAIRLAAQGRLDLAAPVDTLLPAFRGLPGFTALELMHQTAGLHSDESGDGPALPPGRASQIDLAGLVARQPAPFDFPPGTAWLYSNANYTVLGALIEAVTRQPLDRALHALVFAPLGLRSLACDRVGDWVTHRATGYGRTDDPAQPFAPAPAVDPMLAGGAGAMRGTVADLCRWHRALLGGRLFDAAHRDLMLRPGRLRDGRLSGANRFSPDDAHYGDTQYACGLLVSGPSEPQPSILHYGSFYGFSAVLQTYRDQQVTFAALCNTDLGPGVPFRAIRKAVRARWVDGPSRPS